jgi:hypothetical protein
LPFLIKSAASGGKLVVCPPPSDASLSVTVALYLSGSRVSMVVPVMGGVLLLTLVVAVLALALVVVVFAVELVAGPCWQALASSRARISSGAAAKRLARYKAQLSMG